MDQEKMPITSSNKVAENDQWQKDYDLSTTLKNRRKKSEEEKAYQIAQELGFPYMDLNIFPINQKTVNLISEKEAKKYNLVVLGKH